MYSVQITTEKTGENRVVERFNDVVEAVVDGLKINARITIKELPEGYVVEGNDYYAIPEV